jgi:hypothetical protein
MEDGNAVSNKRIEDVECFVQNLKTVMSLLQKNNIWRKQFAFFVLVFKPLDIVRFEQIEYVV